MFLVNIKILAKFPKETPVITIYDLQSSSIILVEQCQLQWWNNDNSDGSEDDDMKRLAAKTVVFICDLMNERAFPDKHKDQQLVQQQL